MPVSTRWRIVPGLVLAFVAASAGAQQPDTHQPVAERDGSVTNISAAGPSTRKLDCIAPDAVTSDETPPEVYTGLRSCILRGDFDHAAELFAMAGAFGAFDGQRVADVSARDTPQVLAYLLSGSLSPQQRTDLSAAVTRVTQDPALKQQVCAASAKVGSPTYVPTYMIRHGLDAITQPSAPSPFVPGFDATATWARVRTVYLGCAA